MVEVKSFIGMLYLLKAIRKNAIRDELSYRNKGKKKGEGAWDEWKESKCRNIYYNCYILVKERAQYKSSYPSIPRGQ